MAHQRVLDKRRLIICLIAVACTSERIVTVEPSFVEVAPPDVSAVAGEQVQLVGTVHDDQNNALPGTALEWSSADSSIASVDALGLVTARSPGEVAIRARFESATGEAQVEVLRGPFVVVVPASLTLYTSPGAAPPPQVVAVSNGGARTLEQLIAQVAYDGEAEGWLSPTLASATAPTSLTLLVDGDGLGADSYGATVSVASRAQGDPAEVDVVLNVAGFEVRHTGPGTTVAESGTTDQISVVLSSQPSAPVVLLATGSDPTEVIVTPASLRFSRTDWDREQSITVRGADDFDDDANRVSTVSVTVDGAQSPDEYDALPAQTVSVTTVDDDEPPSLVVVESLGSTVVSEAGTTDNFTVALAAPIASNVLLEVTASSPWEVDILSSIYVTFTPGNWNVPQTVTVFGVNDFFIDGDRQATVTVRVLNTYSDARYHGLFRDVVVTNIDVGIID